MKKQTTLKLHKETIQTLNSKQLSWLDGGFTTTIRLIPHPVPPQEPRFKPELYVEQIRLQLDQVGG